MGLFAIIDSLLVGTYYLGWGIALICIPLSVVLFVCSLSYGVAAAAACLAALLAAAGVTLLLLPKQMKLPLRAIAEKRIVLGGALLALGTVVMGVTYFAAGGLPTMNLLFA